MKRLLILMVCTGLLLGLIGCADDGSTPPPTQAQGQDEIYEERYNSSEPVRDSWEGEACLSLSASIHVIRREAEEVISHVEISADESLLGVVAFGRSLPSKVVDGVRIFTLKPTDAELPRLNDGTTFWAQLYFKGDTVPSVRVRRVFNTHTSTSEGVPNPNMESQRLLSAKEIDELAMLPQLTVPFAGMCFANEVRCFPETGAYMVQYSQYRWMTITPADGKFEKIIQYEMESAHYVDIRLYSHGGVDYYIVEGWPTGPDVTEDSHTFSIRWEKDGYVYDLYLDRAITSHDAAHEIIGGIEY